MTEIDEKTEKEAEVRQKSYMSSFFQSTCLSLYRHLLSLFTGAKDTKFSIFFLLYQRQEQGGFCSCDFGSWLKWIEDIFEKWFPCLKRQSDNSEVCTIKCQKKTLKGGPNAIIKKIILLWKKEEKPPPKRLLYAGKSWAKDGFARRAHLEDEEEDTVFCSNYISTTKYTVVTFLPLNLFEQFQKK
ncbi:hypothetical protein RFI_14535, partial [Reticulomyxa filosa]